MPVWLITTEKENTTYTFAINGQTGKLTCDVPADTKKSLLWGFGVFAGALALACVICMMTGMLNSVGLVLALLFALIVAFVVVGAMLGELKQAGSVQGAGNYAVQGSFELFVKEDRFLHQTQTRRKIEQKPSNGK